MSPPDGDEVANISRGVTAVLAGPGGSLRPVQHMVLDATFQSMTGHRGSFEPQPDSFAASLAALGDALRFRTREFRMRIVQQALLGALVVDPIAPDVIARLRRMSHVLGVDENMIDVAGDFADQQFELAAIDFDRNGYTADWDPSHAEILHASRPIEVPWGNADHDHELAARWQALESLPEGSLGLAVSRFYRARGFVYPGLPGAVSPLLAQHDWVHVVADYGAVIDNELEVFAFIARANDDPKGFSFLAMVVSLFETGVLASGAGLFTPDVGHLQLTGMPERVADAMRRGALCRGSIDFLALDWFELAERPLGDVRDEFGIVAKSDQVASPGPFELGGMTSFQVDSGRAAAATRGVAYETWGAGPPTE
jgi:PAS domain-containing protein